MPKADREPTPAEGGPTLVERIVLGQVSTGHLATFCRQFASYLDAGVPLIKAAGTACQKQFARTALGPVIGRLSLTIRRGDSLGDAFARERQAFDPLFLSMIRVAEARRRAPPRPLPARMGCDRHYEAKRRLFRQARSALIYPASVVLIATIVGGLLTIFILPKLVGLLEDIAGKGRADLPAPTRALIALSHFVQTIGWFVLPLGFFGGLFGLAWLYRTPRGKAALDEVSLYIPVFGKLLRKIDIARFARTLSALLSAGVDYGESLDLTADVLHLVPLRRAIRGARSLVLEGDELSDALNTSRRFPPDVIAIVNSGEETGRLPETLEKLADDYEEQVEYMVKNLGSLIQPLIILVLGGIVGFIVLAFVMAYVSVISGLAGGASET